MGIKFKALRTATAVQSHFGSFNFYDDMVQPVICHQQGVSHDNIMKNSRATFAKLCYIYMCVARSFKIINYSLLYVRNVSFCRYASRRKYGHELSLLKLLPFLHATLDGT